MPTNRRVGVQRWGPSNPSQILPKIGEEGTGSQTFYEANITLILKLEKDITRKENYRQISLTSIDTKFLKEILANRT